MKIIFWLLMSLTSACSSLPMADTLPGAVRFKDSKIDGEKSLYMIPGWIPYTYMKLGLFVTLPGKSGILLTAKVRGLQKIEKKDSLKFNIDGELIKLSSTDETTEYSTESTTNWSSKTYMVDKDLIEKLVKAKSAYVSFGSLEGEFSSRGLTTAKPGFIEFLKQYNDKVK